MRLNYLFVAIVFALSVNAKGVLIDGLYYTFDSEKQTAQVMNVIHAESNLFSSTGYIAYSGDIVIPETVFYDGKPYTVTSIANGYDEHYYGYFNLFSEGTVTSLTIPQTVTKVGRYAFDKCSFNKLVFKGKVNCDLSEFYTWRCEVEDIYIEDVVSWVGSGFCIQDVSGLFVGGIHLRYKLYLNNILVNNIIIPEGIKSIGFSLAGCSNISSITLPSSINKYDNLNCLAGCDNLLDLFVHTKTAPSWDGIPAGDIRPHTTLHVYDYAIESFKTNDYWKKFKSIEPIVVTDFNLTYYVDGTEYKIKTHKYGEAITPEAEPTKKGMTFSGWSEIPETMPGKDVEVRGTFSWSKKTIDGVTCQVTDADNETAEVIGNDNASGEITIADAVEFGDGTYKVTKIADNAFNGRNTITRFDISKNVTSIGEKAFANINKLNDVYCYAEEVPETDRTAFENSYIDYVTLHVPAGSIDKYKAVGPWKNFKDVVAINNDAPVCETPTINYDGDQILFECETEQVSFVYDIEAEDAIGGEGDKTTLGGVYNVSVYATKKGYTKSKTATKKITVKPKRGDLNGDGKVNAADHVTLSNIIMNQEEAEE